MKKILLLGGAAHQVPVIVTAKRLGYYTILCDCYSDCPGKQEADLFVPISTIDREDVLCLARKEHLDGILAYASDPAALTAAYVQEKMHLPCGIPYDAVCTLSNKFLFRSYESKYHFQHPLFVDLSYQENIGTLRYPIVVKPCDCSGSRGVRVVRNKDELASAWEDAHRYSHIGAVLGEQYMPEGTHIIGGDVLIMEGHVEYLGLFDCVRDAACPLIPVGKNWPCDMSENDREMILNNFQRLSNSLHIQSAVLNVELCIDGKHRPVILDIGPRAGGNRIPELLSEITGMNWIELMIQMAMGEDVSEYQRSIQALKGDPEKDYYRSLYVLHTLQKGILESIQYDRELLPYLTMIHQDTEEGEMVQGFENASQKLGICFLKFPDFATQQDVMSRIGELVHIRVREAAVV